MLTEDSKAKQETVEEEVERLLREAWIATKPYRDRMREAERIPQGLMEFRLTAA